MQTYKIVRMWRDDPGTRVIKRGLTLRQAQEHCKRDDTRGVDASGPWFDGYETEKTAMQHNYGQIEHRLGALAPFTGNTLRGDWSEDRETFSVWSYGTIIAEYDAITQNAWINHKRYSVTTSRHQNIVRRVWFEERQIQEVAR